MKPHTPIKLAQILEPEKQAPVAAASRWQHFTTMPHHMLFAIGATQAVLVMLWWLIDLGGRYGGWYAPVEWALPSPWAHTYLMIFSLFPPFMFGFLMTTYPKWMAGVPVARKHYLATAALLGTAAILGYSGLALGKSWLLLAMGLHLAGWAMGIYALLRVYAGAQRPDTLHALVTSATLVLGWLLLLLYVLGAARVNVDMVAIARSGGVWWFLFPVFFAVSHRLIPFFSSVVLPDYRIIRPDWVLWLMSSGALAHGVLEILGKTGETWLADLPMAATAAWLAYAWSFRQSFQTRILAMLHIAFAWLGVALALYGVQSLTILAGADWQFGRAPLHALVVGYFSSMLVAMATRVTLGHSGQPLTADNLAWGIFLTIQVAALLRVVADFPAIDAYAPYFYLCSALLWLAAFLGWMGKFLPIYWQPR